MRTLKNSVKYMVVCGLLAVITNVAVASDDPAVPGAEYPAMSPDGTKLVFTSNQNGSRDLWVARADGSDARQLTQWPDSDEKQPSWSQDGTRIVFSSNRGASRHNIWVIDVNGANATQLTSDDAQHEHPQYSPNGLTILFLSNSTGKKELWVMNADGSAQRAIALISRLVSDPAWSPNGSEIVYVGCRRGAECNLFRINANGSGGTQITTGDFQDWTPDWGVQGIVFASNRGGSQGLWLVQPDGSGLRQLTSPQGTADLDPRWVGNTGMLVFSRSGKSVGDSASDIWSLAGLDGATKQLTSVGSPLSVKQAVLRQLIALRASVVDRQEGIKLDLAITHLTKALDPTLWIDGSHPQPTGGEVVFNQEKDAVNQLRIIVRDTSTVNSPTIEDLIQRLVLADRVLAMVGIADAVARNANSTEYCASQLGSSKG